MSPRIFCRTLIVIAGTMFCLFFQVIAQTRITSEFLRKTADSLAITHATDSKLALVTCSGMDTTGKSDVWSYVYLAADSLKEYHFHAQINQVIFDSSNAMRVGIMILVNPWINSDSALIAAERSGGINIRRRFPTCTLMASLMSYDSPPFLCVWRINYKCTDSTRTIIINAANGVVLSVNNNTNPIIPGQIVLYQNYPNPFNPSTNILFSLSSKSFVLLKVYDIIGRDVATIISGELSAGNHSRQWNAANVPSGIYFYRLKASTLSETRKLVLLR